MYHLAILLCVTLSGFGLSVATLVSFWTLWAKRHERLCEGETRRHCRWVTDSAIRDSHHESEIHFIGDTGSDGSIPIYIEVPSPLRVKKGEAAVKD